MNIEPSSLISIAAYVIGLAVSVGYYRHAIDALRGTVSRLTEQMRAVELDQAKRTSSEETLEKILHLLITQRKRPQP